MMAAHWKHEFLISLATASVSYCSRSIADSVLKPEMSIAALPLRRAKTAPKATVTVEAAGKQFDITAIADKAVAAYKAMNEKAAVKTVDVYVKPEEGVAYYVINGEGSADFKVEL